MKYILALDQGTTSSRAALVSEEGKIVCILNREFPQLYPREGWVEHDPTDIWGSQYGIMMEVLAKSGVGAEEIAAIGITNQRETAIVWEKATGKPVYNAIVWQCRRTAERIEEIVKSGAGEMIRKKTGLIPDAYFSASKAEWILDRADPKRERAKRGELLFGTVDSYLVWKLTGGKVHATDRTNAARTMLFNIHTLDWDDELLELFHIPREMLPEVKSSGELYGYAPVGGVEIPVFGVAGDQQSALFGQCCFQAGEAKNTYGTGCFLLMNTGETPAESKNGLLTTVAATLKGEPAQYALEGSVFIGGAVIQWLRDEMRFFAESKDAEYYAGKVPDTGGVYLVPAFTGMGAPYWDMYARGTIVGLTRGSTKAHIARAVLECIAYQTADLVRVMNADAPCPLTELRVDGGASVSDILMQIQADLLRLPVDRPAQVETTAFGAAALAGLAVGVWNGFDELAALRRSQCVFRPQREEEACLADLARWHRAVERSRSWIENNV